MNLVLRAGAESGNKKKATLQTGGLPFFLEKEVVIIPLN
jgi:hypothetical protein